MKWFLLAVALTALTYLLNGGFTLPTRGFTSPSGG